MSFDTIDEMFARIVAIHLHNLKDKNEIAIYDKYKNIGKRITIMFMGLLLSL